MHSALPVTVPRFTRVALSATLAITATALAVFFSASPDPADARDSAAYLFLFTALFLLRVAGQLFVRRRQPRWLPLTEQWNLSPYHLLLPTQLGILALMGWIDTDFARGVGFWVHPRPAFGSAVSWFALVYALAMVVRYIVQMIRQTELRWYGGTIPIVFHFVLAGYLFVLGSFHASH